MSCAKVSMAMGGTCWDLFRILLIFRMLLYHLRNRVMHPKVLLNLPLLPPQLLINSCDILL